MDTLRPLLATPLEGIAQFISAWTYPSSDYTTTIHKPVYCIVYPCFYKEINLYLHIAGLIERLLVERIHTNFMYCNVGMVEPVISFHTIKNL